MNAEIDEITQKIASLDNVRNQLQQSLLRLHEEELELDEELENVTERLAFEERSAPTATMPRTGKRRKGPAFLPSEHDELPPGVAFMVRQVAGCPSVSLTSLVDAIRTYCAHNCARLLGTLWGAGVCWPRRLDSCMGPLYWRRDRPSSRSCRCVCCVG